MTRYDDYDNNETEIIPRSNNRSEEYSDDNYYDTSSYGIDHLLWNNLPDDAISGKWVSQEYYNKLYDKAHDSAEDAAEYLRLYGEAYDRNQRVEHELDVLNDKMNTTAAENAAAKARNEDKERDLYAREEEMESQFHRDKIIIVGVSIVAAILCITTIVFGVKYFHELENSRSSDSIGSVQEEQLSTMRTNLDKAQQERNDALQKSNDLQGQVDKLVNDLKASEDKRVNAEKSLEESNTTLDQMTNKINDLSGRASSTQTTVSTVTETESASPVTVTHTVEPSATHSVTTSRSNN